jgi:hypothetical protein
MTKLGETMKKDEKHMGVHLLSGSSFHGDTWYDSGYV